MLSWGRNQMDKKWGTCLKAGTILVTLLGGLGFQTTHAVADASGSSASTSDTDSAFNISGAPDIDHIEHFSGSVGAGSVSAQSKAAVGYEDRFTSTPVLSLVPNFDFGADHKKSEKHNDFDLINPKGTQRYLIVEDQHGFANWSVKVQNSSTGVFFNNGSGYAGQILLNFKNLECYYATKDTDSNNQVKYSKDTNQPDGGLEKADNATIDDGTNHSSAIIMKHDYSAKPPNGGAHIYAVDFNGTGENNSSVTLTYPNNLQPNKKEIETATLTWTLQVTL